MPRPYETLRRVLRYYDWTTEQLADEIGIGRAALSRSLNNKRPFTMDEAYTILELFHIDHSKLNTVFPKGGF